MPRSLASMFLPLILLLGLVVPVNAVAATRILPVAPNRAVPPTFTSSGSAPRSISASSTANPPQTANSTTAMLAAWKATMLNSSVRQAGCFVATYPGTVWQPTPCSDAPPGTYAASSAPLAIQPSTVGGPNTDMVGYSTIPAPGGLIASSVGSFQTSGLTDETGDSICRTPNGANCYSLQINTQPDFGPVTTPYTNNLATLAWEQFIYSNDASSNTGEVFIEFWLKGYYTQYSTCPPALAPLPAWTDVGGDCVVNTLSQSTPSTPATSLSTLSFGGSADYGGNGLDVVTLCISASCYGYSLTDNVLNLYENWGDSEFNVFGDGGHNGVGSEANFNTISGAPVTITVSNALYGHNGAGITPACDTRTYTAETNNLDLNPSTCQSTNAKIYFSENILPKVTMTASYSIVGGEGNPYHTDPYAPSFNVVWAGGPTSYVLGTTPTPYAVDSGTAWSVTPNPLNCMPSLCLPSEERWLSPSTQTLTGTSAIETLNFVYDHQLLLTTGVIPSGGTWGYTYPLPGSYWYDSLSSQSVSATPYSGYLFDHWSTSGVTCSGGPTSNPCTFNMPGTDVGAISVIAVFTPIPYTVIFQQVGIPDGVTWGVTVAETRHTSSSTSVTVSLFYPEQYAYDASVQAPGGGSYTCVSNCSGWVSGIPGSTGSIIATYQPPLVTQILTTGVSSGSGSVLPDCPGGCRVAVGSSVSVIATPSSAYWAFSTWTISGASCSGGASSNPCTITTMPNNPVSVSATFTYTVTFQQSGIPSGATWGVTVGGTRYTSTTSSVTRSGLSGTVSYSYDASVPALGGGSYTCVSGCSGSVGGPTTVAATYQPQLTVGTNPPGVATIPGAGSYAAGTVVTLQAPLGSGGYVFLHWEVDGMNQGDGIASITVTMNAPHAATAHYGTSKDAIKSLSGQVQSLGLSGGNTNSLLVKLNHALDKLNAGQTKVACNELKAFINQVNNFVATGVLDAATGARLVSQAQAMINAVSSGP